jgi:hypothetical protein
MRSRVGYCSFECTATADSSRQFRFLADLLQILGVEVYTSRAAVQGLRLRVQGAGCRVQGEGSGCKLRVEG